MTFKGKVAGLGVAGVAAVGIALGAPAAGASPAPTTYTVQPGDTLSSIAQKFDTSWVTLDQINHLANPNLIYAGQVLAISGSAPAPAATPQPTAQATTGYAAAPVEHQSYGQATTSYSTSSSGAGGGNASCIIQHESGGDAQVMNSSGHYGLYQFSEGTWVANGGSAADFGHASVAEQNQVFQNTVASSGYAPWAGDGC